MPSCTVHILSLAPTVSLPSFLLALSRTSLKPLTIARVIRWIILPSHISTSPLLAQNVHWDILIILSSTSSLPAELQNLIAHQWTVQTGVPGKILQGFGERNKRMLWPHKGDVPSLTGALIKPKIAASSQGLELTEELKEWIDSFGKEEGKGAVSMLNLLSFKEGKKEEYLKYGVEFARSIGSSRGGKAKIVGSVIHPKDRKDEGEGWDEMALAHYPTIYHFADMLASEDYQAVNKRYRVGSLRDTFILCTSELGMEDLMSRGGSKL